MTKQVQLHFAVLFSSMLLVGCDRFEQTQEDYLKKGADLLAKGDLASAELELKNAIQKNPDIADAYYQMALLNEKGRNYKAMRVNLHAFLERNPEHTEGRIKLAKVQLLFNESEQAMSEIDRVLSTDADNEEALVVKAQVLNRQQQDESAWDIITRLLDRNPDFVDALILKAAMLLKQDKLSEGLEAISHAMTLDADNVSLHLLRIQYHTKLKDLGALLTDYRRLAEIQPENEEIQYVIARILFQKGEKNQAEQSLRNLIAAKPTQLRPKLALLGFLYATSAVQSFKQFDIFLDQSNPQDQVGLAKWAFSKNATEKGRQALRRVIENSDAPDKPIQEALFILAQLEHRNKNYAASHRYIEKILALNPEHEGARVLSYALLVEQKQYDSAEDKLNRFLWEKPKSDAAMVLLARIFSDRGERVKAFQKYEEALKINPGNKAALLPLVDRAIKKQHHQYAGEMLQRALAKNGESLELLQLYARVSMEARDWDMTDKIIDVISNKRRGKVLAQLLKGQKLSKQEKFEQSNEVYRAILQQYPWHSASLSGLGFNYERLDKRREFVKFLDQFISSHPAHSAAHIMKARALSIDRHNDQAIRLLKKFVEDYPNVVSAYSELAELYIKSGRRDLGKTLYLEGLRRSPENSKLLMGLASLQQEDGQSSDAIKTYEKVLSLNPDNNVAKNNLASLLVDVNSDESLGKAVSLTAEFKESEQPYFLDTYAWVRFKAGDIDYALKILKEVIIIAPEVPVFHYHLAQIQYKAGNTTEAKSALRQAIQLASRNKFAELNDAKRMLTELH